MECPGRYATGNGQAILATQSSLWQIRALYWCFVEELPARIPFLFAVGADRYYLAGLMVMLVLDHGHDSVTLASDAHNEF